MTSHGGCAAGGEIPLRIQDAVAGEVPLAGGGAARLGP